MRTTTDNELDEILEEENAEIADDLVHSEPLVSTEHMRGWYRYDMAIFDISNGAKPFRPKWIVLTVDELDAYRERLYLQRNSYTDDRADIETPQGKVALSFPDQYDEFMLLIGEFARKIKESER